MSRQKEVRLSEQPDKCPRCKKKTVSRTPAAYYCTRVICGWSVAKMPPYGSPSVVERRDY